QLDVLLARIETDDVDKLDYDLKQAIYATCENSRFKKKKKQMNKSIRYAPKWFDQDCKRAQHNKKIALRKFRRNQVDIHTYNRLKIEYKQICEKKRQDHRSKLTEKLS